MAPAPAQSRQYQSVSFPQLIWPRVGTGLFTDALVFSYSESVWIIAETSCFLPLGSVECDNIVLTFADPNPPNSDVRGPIPAVKQHVKEEGPLPTFVIFVEE